MFEELFGFADDAARPDTWRQDAPVFCSVQGIQLAAWAWSGRTRLVPMT